MAWAVLVFSGLLETVWAIALDRSAGLPAVEDDRLIIKDAPLVEDMSIGANGIGSPPRVEPCRPQITCRLQAHHVGRGEQPASP